MATGSFANNLKMLKLLCRTTVTKTLVMKVVTVSTSRRSQV